VKTGTLVSDLTDCLDDVLGVRQEIGALKAKISRVTRTWTGIEPGDGEMTEVIEYVEPQPGIQVYGHDLRVREGGNVLQGDLLLGSLSKENFDRDQAACRNKNKLIETFYQVGNDLYRVIGVIEGYVTYKVQVRRLTDQRRKAP
jgi:hypothetical protein